MKCLLCNHDTPHDFSDLTIMDQSWCGEDCYCQDVAMEGARRGAEEALRRLLAEKVAVPRSGAASVFRAVERVRKEMGLEEEK